MVCHQRHDWFIDWFLKNFFQEMSKDGSRVGRIRCKFWEQIRRRLSGNRERLILKNRASRITQTNWKKVLKNFGHLFITLDVPLWNGSLNSSQPAYLRSLLSYQTPARSLRSSNTNLLSVPRVHTTFASRGFSLADLSVWNSLPADIHACSSSHTLTPSSS